MLENRWMDRWMDDDAEGITWTVLFGLVLDWSCILGLSCQVLEKTLKMRSFIFSKLGHADSTIAMFDLSSMRSCQTGGLAGGVSLDTLRVHQTSHR